MKKHRPSFSAPFQWSGETRTVDRVGGYVHGRGHPAILQTGKSPDPLGRPEHYKKKILDFFYFFSPKKLEKYDLTRPKMSKYSLTS